MPMKNKRVIYFFLFSLLLHAGFFLLINNQEFFVQKPKEIAVTIIHEKKKTLKSVFLRRQLLARAGSRKFFDLRPGYIKKIYSMSTGFSTKEINHAAPDFDKNQNEELLLTESKVWLAFDALAENINKNLIYPELLIENGIEGVARLDLYFDENGEIEENKSEFSGDNRLVRGLLVRAVRESLIHWYARGDIYRLKKEQLKNQHFQAQFSLTQFLSAASTYERVAPNNYLFVRRHNLNQCAQPTGVDITCVAMRISGAIKNTYSQRARLRFYSLQDELEYFDKLKLNGVNGLIRINRG